MDKKKALWAALKLRSDLSRTAVLPADEVRATGLLVGLDDAALVTVVTQLSEESLVRLHWGGNVEVLESKAETGRPLVHNFYGAVGAVGERAGQGGSFDLRGGGQGGGFSEAGGAEPEKLKAIITRLAAASAELRAHAPALPPEEAAQIEAIAKEADNAAREAQDEAPNETSIISRLRRVREGAEEVSKLQKTAEQIGPTLRLLKNAVSGALAHFGFGS